MTSVIYMRFMLNVVMLNVVMLSAVILSVVAFLEEARLFYSKIKLARYLSCSKLSLSVRTFAGTTSLSIVILF
jgi:hypothetical protein